MTGSEHPNLGPARLEVLLEEYRANLALWQHDDNLRQSRTGNLLTVNTILVAALSIVIGSDPDEEAIVIATAALVSLFGLTICIVWDLVQRRNAEYVRFRRHQILSVEAQLPELETFANTSLAFDHAKPVRFRGGEEQFELKPRARHSSTAVEGLLSKALIVAWALVFLAAAAWGIAAALG